MRGSLHRPVPSQERSAAARSNRTLLAALLALALSIAVVAISAAIGLQSAEKHVGAVIRDRVVPLKELKDLSDIHTVDIPELAESAEGGGMAAAEFETRAAGLKARVDRLWQAYLATGMTDQERHLASLAQREIARTDRVLARLGDAVASADAARITEVAQEELRPAIAAVRSAIQPLIDLQIDVAHAHFGALQETQWQLWTIFAALLVAGCLSLLGAYKISLRLIRRDAVNTERYRLLAEHSSDIISILDRNLVFTFISPAVRNIFGYAPAEVVGRSILDFIHPEDRAPLERGFRRCAVNGSATITPHRCLRDGGTEVWIECNAQAITDAEGRDLFITVSRDIGERRAAEQALRKSHAILDAIVEGSRDPIFVRDVQGRTVFTNKAARRVLGIDGSSGGTAELPAAFIERFREQDAQVIATGTPMNFEDVVQNGDGSRTFLSTKTPWRSPEGELLGVFGITHDITDLKTHQEELERAKEEAEAGNRAKSSFLANMSHELRTPLNAVIGFAELVETEIFGPLGDARYLDYAANIRKGGQHLLRLINEILDLSKIEAGKLLIEEAWFDPSATIRECVSLLEPRATQTGVELHASLPSTLPDCLGDEARIAQALLNLLSNALKFTPTGGKAVIAAGVDHEAGLWITVTDTGIGIEQADIPKLFRPFSQVANVMTRTSEGAGLGLAIARHLIELHGGTLSLDSVVGRGTVARIALPPSRSSRLVPDQADANSVR